MRILVIEDQVKLANATKKALESQLYAVDIALNGESGLDLAIGENYNLIILDLMLPGINGIVVCQKIREAEITTPILMLTAKGQITDKVTGLDVGADDYMVKPYSFVELFARIRALTRRPGNIQNTTLKVNDLTLSLKTYTVKRGGKEIFLSNKEFSILEYLMRYKNTVLTRDNIISQVWNYEANILPSTVEVHIKNLRDKIDLKNTPNPIKTIRGRGYTIR